jgi:uncharacterized protein YbjT (DUF2867 family)
MTYLVTGATGSVGRQVVDQLIASGASVHALSRNPSGAGLPPAVKVFHGDLASAAVDAKAFNGVEGLFLFPAEVDLRPFLAAAKAGGVRHAVVLSSLAVAAEFSRDVDSASRKHHLAVETAAADSGLETTFLRSGTFAKNLLAWAPTIKKMRSVFLPYPESSQALIHEADIAAVAVAALTDPRHRGKTYALTGPQSMTQLEQLKTIGDALGIELSCRKITTEQFRESVAQYMSADIVKMLLDYWSDTVHTPDVARPTVERIIGRPALTLARWANDHIADFT